MASMNEILRDIAAKINDKSSSAILSDLLVIYSIDARTQAEIDAIVSRNLRWLDTHTNDIQGFLDDFHSSAATLSSFVGAYLVIMFGFYSLNWIIMEN